MIFNTIQPFSVIFQVSQFLLRPFLNHVFICNNFYYCNIAIRGYLRPSQFYWDTFWNFFASHLSSYTVWVWCFECFVDQQWSYVTQIGAPLYVYSFWLADQTENFINNKSSCLSIIATYFNFAWFCSIFSVLTEIGLFIAFSRL